MKQQTKGGEKQLPILDFTLTTLPVEQQNDNVTYINSVLCGKIYIKLL